jgi:hypothetical protein
MVTFLSILKPKRSWLQYRLRTLFVLVVVIAAPCVLTAWKMDAKRRERTAVAFIENDGGYCQYRWQREDQPHPPGSEWLRRLLGEDFFADVEEVRLDGSNETDDVMNYVRDMTHLRFLTLRESQLTDEGLSNVERMNGLQELGLGCTHITDDGMKYLEGLTNLESVNLDVTQVSDTGLKHLEGLTRLKALSLFHTHITDTGLNHLAKLTSLESLCLSLTPITDSGLKHLYGLIELKDLQICCTQVTESGVSELQKALPNCGIFIQVLVRPNPQ